MLERETILKVTESVLRRHGPAKASVVDVARALGVSHGTVYRHFPSKAALREAVTRRWIDRTHHGLADAADDRALPAPDRLRHWLRTVFQAKRATALDDPELFGTYCELVKEQSGVVADHVGDLLRQIAEILGDGMASGRFARGDLASTARAVFDATSRFHHPSHAEEWRTPTVDAEFDALCDLILSGLRPRE